MLAVFISSHASFKKFNFLVIFKLGKKNQGVTQCVLNPSCLSVRCPKKKISVTSSCMPDQRVKILVKPARAPPAASAPLARMPGGCSHTTGSLYACRVHVKATALAVSDKKILTMYLYKLQSDSIFFFAMFLV